MFFVNIFLCVLLILIGHALQVFSTDLDTDTVSLARTETLNHRYPALSGSISPPSTFSQTIFHSLWNFSLLIRNGVKRNKFNYRSDSSLHIHPISGTFKRVRENIGDGNGIVEVNKSCELAAREIYRCSESVFCVCMPSPILIKFNCL